MKKIIIFGAGKSGVGKYNPLIEKYDIKVVAYTDNDSKKWGGGNMGDTSDCS